jgi:hypothetical protein
MKKRIRDALEVIIKLWKRSDAQDLVEYALLLLMVALAVAATTRTFGRSVKNSYAGALVGLAGIVGSSVNGTGVSVAAGSSAAALNAAAAANSSLAAAYNANAQAALNAGTAVAAFDYAAAAALIGDQGITIFGAAIGGAAFDDAAAANTSTATRAAADVAAANNNVTLAASLVNAAVAALNGTGGI